MMKSIKIDLPPILSIKRVSISSIINQLNQNRTSLLLGGFLGLVIIIATYVISLIFDVPVSSLTRDPSSVTHSFFLTGFMSTFGLMLWSGTVGICLLTVSTLLPISLEKRSLWFFGVSGSFSLLLLVDDAYLIHEMIFPTYLHLRAERMEMMYLIFIISFLFYFRDYIFSTDYILLGTALIFFAASLWMDRTDQVPDFGTFVEDSFKVLGIIFWLFYFFRVALQVLRKQVENRNPQADSNQGT